LLTFISTIYLLLDGHRLANGLQRFFPLEQRPRLSRVMNRIRRTWGSYVRAQLFLAALMAVLSWLILSPIFGLLGLLSHPLFGGSLPFALPLAIAIGLLETVPIVGPLAALGLAAIVALAQYGILPALMVIAVLYLVRLVEDNIVIPNVLGQAIHLPAIVTLFAVTVGGIVAGLVGLLLAVPMAAAVKVVMDEYYPHPHPALAVAAAASTNHKSAKPETQPAQLAPAAQEASPDNELVAATAAAEVPDQAGIAAPVPSVEAAAPTTQPPRRARRKSVPPGN
jgi:predicted PurR-regulated permease PerM